MSEVPKAILCEVFRSPRTEGMYLYVERGANLERVPEELLKAFGTPESALVFHLRPDRRLAQADPLVVLGDIAARGFYLQMPPAQEEGATGMVNESEVGAC